MTERIMKTWKRKKLKKIWIIAVCQMRARAKRWLERERTKVQVRKGLSIRGNRITHKSKKLRIMQSF